MDPIYFDVFGHKFSIWDKNNTIFPPGVENQLRLFMSGAPIVGGFIKSEDNWNYLNDYLNNRGIDWADVKYPSRAVGMPALGSVASGVSFVSRNIEHLYD